MVYDEYYDSNVEYIGTIPKSWDLVHNKHLFNKTKVIVGPNWDKYPILSLTKQGVIIKDIENNQGKMPSDFSIYQIVNPGNLLMCLFDIDVTPRCVGYIENKGIVSAAYTELSATTEIDMKYYYWWYLMLDIDKQLLHLSKNLRNSLPTEDFMALAVVKPPLKEQQQIANYLDKKTAKIDETIAKNEKLIQLLEEKRVALINQVVTKGLNPDVPMKDSGIEWIGEIPEPWDIVPFKRLFNNIKDGTHGSFQRVSNGKPLLSAKNIFNDTINISENESLISEEDFHAIVSNGFPKRNDLLLTIVGTIGRSCVYDKDYPLAFQRSVSFIRLTQDNPYFYNYFIKSDIFYSQLMINAKESAQKGVYLNDIKECVVIKPPIETQIEIADYLDNEVSKINKTIVKIKENITLLEEYKTSLIHHAVTGKIDVRGEEI